MEVLGQLIALYVEVFTRILRRMEVVLSKAGIEVRYEEQRPTAVTAIDDRLAKIELARVNLLEGLTAIDELKAAAEANKADAEATLREVHKLRKKKSALRKEADSIREIVDADIETFQRIAGVTTPAQRRNDRLIGFASGVVASIFATFLWWVIPKIYEGIFGT